MDLAVRFLANSAQRQECYISKIWAKSTNLGRFGLLGRRIAGMAGKMSPPPPPPHTEIGAGVPPIRCKKKSCAGRRMGVREWR
jgi:hypothetical protein